MPFRVHAPAIDGAIPRDGMVTPHVAAHHLYVMAW